MKRLSPPDRVLTVSVLALMTLGVLMVYSASLSISEVRYGDPLRIILHWVCYIPLALMIIWGLSRIEVTWWRAMAFPMLLAALLLMVLVLVPGVGKRINGAQRWFSLFGMTLQPVELLKPVLFVYMAYYMTAFPERLRQFATGLAPMLVVLGVALALLMLQPDFGSSALLFGVCLCLWFVGGVPMRHLAGLLFAFVPLGVLAVVAEPYRMQRLVSFMDPWSDPFGSGYQLVQSLIGFGSGGLFGVGLGQGVQKLFYLPEVFTDFISATIAEELGLVGMLALIALFSVLLGRGIHIALREEQPFQRLLVLACTLSIGFTFFINLGAAMGLLPTKGMPLPFISYGGSALIGNSILIGLMLSVQRHRPENRRREKPAGGKR
ncbi:MAG: putative lipid II flippase FtsW [Zetaproteobacteria bacterium]|nr:MAG: putative lipid II flippase FtsW [Zetaproteobacteria bacterium]